METLESCTKEILRRYYGIKNPEKELKRKIQLIQDFSTKEEFEKRIIINTSELEVVRAGITTKTTFENILRNCNTRELNFKTAKFSKLLEMSFNKALFLHQVLRNPSSSEYIEVYYDLKNRNFVVTEGRHRAILIKLLNMKEFIPVICRNAHQVPIEYLK